MLSVARPACSCAMRRGVIATRSSWSLPEVRIWPGPGVVRAKCWPGAHAQPERKIVATSARAPARLARFISLPFEFTGRAPYTKKSPPGIEGRRALCQDIQSGISAAGATRAAGTTRAASATRTAGATRARIRTRTRARARAGTRLGTVVVIAIDPRQHADGQRGATRGPGNRFATDAATRSGVAARRIAALFLLGATGILRKRVRLRDQTQCDGQTDQFGLHGGNSVSRWTGYFTGQTISGPRGACQSVVYARNLHAVALQHRDRKSVV